MQLALLITMIVMSLFVGGGIVVLILYVYRTRIESAVIKGDHTQPPIMLTLGLAGDLPKLSATFVFDSNCRYSQIRRGELRYLHQHKPEKEKPSEARLHNGATGSTDELGWTVVAVKLGKRAFLLHCLVVPNDHLNCLGCYPLLTKYDVLITALKVIISKPDPLSPFLRFVRLLSKKK